MTLGQKIGQMTQIDLDSITDNSQTDFSYISDNFLGSILVGGNGVPSDDGNVQTG